MQNKLVWFLKIGSSSGSEKKLEPEGSKLQLQIPGVDFLATLGSEFAGASHMFDFYRMKLNPWKK